MTGNGDSARLEDIARRHSQRQGYRLVHYRGVGLPHYYLRLRVVVMQEKELPPISEFVMKAIEAGLVDLADISGFLGLEGPLVEAAMIELRRSEEIDLQSLASGGQQRWTLTEKGRRTLQNAKRVAPEETSIGVYYDGLLRQVVQVSPEALVEPRQLRSDDRMEIRPIPARPPHADELSLDEINRWIAAYVKKKPGSPNRELLVVKAVLKPVTLYRPAVMLIFQAIGRDEIQVAFAVDGALSQEHESAFAGADGPRVLGISQNVARPSVSEMAATLLRDTAASKLGDLGAAEALELEEDAAIGALRAAERKLEGATTEADRASQQSKVAEAEERVTRARTAIQRLGVKLVPMLEHRALLDRALQEAQHRLLINSPWIHSSAVDHSFLRRLENRLIDGLSVFIAYGLEKEKRPYASYVEAEESLKSLARTYPNFHLTKLGDTHAKILICDESFMVVTSFNWLSFRGDRDKVFRDERGVMVTLPEIINEQFDLIHDRMSDVEKNIAGGRSN